MIEKLTSLVCFLFFLFLKAQTELIKDIDFDNIKDTVYIDPESNQIVSLLPTQKIKKIKSSDIEFLSGASSLHQSDLN